MAQYDKNSQNDEQFKNLTPWSNTDLNWSIFGDLKINYVQEIVEHDKLWEPWDIKAESDV